MRAKGSEPALVFGSDVVGRDEGFVKSAFCKAMGRKGVVHSGVNSLGGLGGTQFYEIKACNAV